MHAQWAVGSRCRTFKLQAAWREAMMSKLDHHKTTGTQEAATPPRRWKPVSAKWMFSYKADKDGMIAKKNARLGSNGFSQRQQFDYFHTFPPTPSSASIVILLAIENEQGLKIFQ